MCGMQERKRIKVTDANREKNSASYVCNKSNILQKVRNTGKKYTSKDENSAKIIGVIVRIILYLAKKEREKI